MITIRIPVGLRQLALALGLAVLSSTAFAQGPDGLPPGVTREQMWPAPTAEDWKRPCLITWQRSYEDALAVSRETNKPILVCVNMDGEIASEHYAGVRYRQPEIAALYEPYVCVIASVYRHNPRDYDEQGHRILCPRFGSVTCGEHIAIEPGLFEKFFDGQRVAPRHIGVELDSKEMYDVFYAWDTDTIFNSLKDGIAERPTAARTIVRGDRPLVERVASRDINDRVAVEASYNQGDAALKRALLEAALQHADAAPIELLRLAVFGFDVELSQLARRALAQSPSEGAVPVIAEALCVPMETSERDALIGALKRLGETSPKARMLAVVHQRLNNRSSVVDVEGWSKALEAVEAAAPPARDGAAMEALLESQDQVLAAKDPARHLELALAFLERGKDEIDQAAARLLYSDAHQTALRAEQLGASGWRVNGAIALTAYYLGDRAEAYARAETAVSAMPRGETDWNAMAVLGLFAEGRRQAIVDAVREKTDWPSWSKALEGAGQWLTDVHAAYSVLARHPLGTDAQVAAHYDLLKVLGAAGQASRVLDQGLSRFPDSVLLHDRLRRRILEEKGLDGLEPAYEAMLAQKDAPRVLEQFAGYASLVAAEFHRRAGRAAQALAAYDRGIAHYQHAIEADPESRAAADHYAALAMAGRARLAYERGDDAAALTEVLASFERSPGSAATEDGLGISPVATAKMLLARLTEQKHADLAERLEAALGKLDPELLRLPENERDGSPSPDARRRRRGQQGS